RDHLYPLLLVSLPHPATSPTPPLSLHDALPISAGTGRPRRCSRRNAASYRLGSANTVRSRSATCVIPLWGRTIGSALLPRRNSRDRKSTRLNSSHVSISYAVFCLKKKIDQLTNI